MTKLLLLLLSLVAIVYSAHSDHSDAVVSAKDSSDGHHVREHSEDDHQRSTDNGNVRTRNGDKHADGMVALIDSMELDDEEVYVEVDDEDDAESHSDHERSEDIEDHPDHEEVQNEEEHPDHEDAGIFEDHPDHEKLKEDDDEDVETEDHEDTVSEDDDAGRTDLGELEYAGQGQGDERARGSFDRDEEIEGRHDVFESPQEVHEEDHEGLFEDDGEEEVVADDDEATLSEDDEVDDVEEVEAEEVETEEIETEDAEVEIVEHLNENRDLEEAEQFETVDEEAVDQEVDAESERTELGELEYAGQGAGDERARGTFERDEDIEGRHDVFESPQEDHVEPDHENLHDEEQEEVAEEEQEEEDPLKGLDGEGDVVDERVLDDQQQEEEEQSENVEVPEIEEAEGSEEELVAVHGKMERVNGKHFVMSTALLVVTGAAMAVLFVHLMTTWKAKKAVTNDPEYTPLIADKV